MMSFKRYMATSVLLTLPFLICAAQQIRSVVTEAVLNEDGSADITQTWDVEVSDGTEWYLPLNLNDLELSGFSVSENGRGYSDEGYGWRTDRNMAQKASRCGLVKTSSGVELCWGLGSYGAHIWVCSYHLDGVVRSLRDFDAFNHQFVNSGLPSVPQKAVVRIRNGISGEEWTEENTRIWAFGFEGNISLEDGEIVAVADGRFSNMTVMARFEKGMFRPSLVKDEPFEKMQDRAFKGSAYSDSDSSDIWFIILGVLIILLFFGFLLWMLVCNITGNIYRKNFFGKTRIDGWFRDAPLGGDIPSVWYVYSKGFRFRNISPENLVGTFFLKWMLESSVNAVGSADKRKGVPLVFTDREPDFCCPEEEQLYRWAMEASGDKVLERSEFRKWSKKHSGDLMKWPEEITDRGFSNLVGSGRMLSVNKAEPSHREALCQVMEFRNFLNDFTLSSERSASEVAVWKHYLVFAQLFGIADTVSEQFSKLYPEMFGRVAEECGVDPVFLLYYISWNNRMSANYYKSAVSTAQGKSASMGMGGATSFGGGGGFSGGGFGGGTR